MKRIGIISFHKSLNYGSVLLSWALQEKLISLGYQVNIINYQPVNYRKLYYVFEPVRSLTDLKINMHRVLIDRSLLRRSFSFWKFRKKNLHITRKRYTAKNLEKLNRRFDVLISGGDQIWNLWALDCDEAYFLPISHGARKIAYAVSINSSDFSDPRANSYYGSNLPDYDYISVREPSGKEKLSAFFNDKLAVAVDIDPIFLNVADFYRKIASDRLVKEKYIFLYTLKCAPDSFESAGKLSEKLGLPVKTIYVGKLSERAAKRGIGIERDHLLPNDFLSYILHAECVVTDSFHGLAFSVLFNKDFYCVNTKRKFDTRLVSLLDTLGLSDRLLDPADFETGDFSRHIDYSKANPIIQENVSASIGRLLSAIEKE